MYLKNLVNKITSRGPVSVTLAVVLSVLVVTATVGAATTISTNINTGGTLVVTGASTLTGNVAAEGTLTVTGATALNGSTTIGNAAADNITIAGHATSSQTFATLGNFYVNGYATTTASSGAIATEGGITVGTGGTAMTRIYKGTCNLTGMDGTQSATTTKAYPCAVTGVVSTDTVFVTLATSTAQFANGWILVGAKASTTAGNIDVVISNLTGTDRVPSVTGVGSSTQYLIIR